MAEVMQVRTNKRQLEESLSSSPPTKHSRPGGLSSAANSGHQETAPIPANLDTPWDPAYNSLHLLEGSDGSERCCYNDQREYSYCDAPSQSDIGGIGDVIDAIRDENHAASLANQAISLDEASFIPFQPRIIPPHAISDLLNDTAPQPACYEHDTFSDSNESGSTVSAASPTTDGSSVPLNRLPSSASAQAPPTDSTASGQSAPSSINGTGGTAQHTGFNPPPASPPAGISSGAMFFGSSPAILILCLLLSTLGIWWQAWAVSTYFDNHPQISGGKFTDPDFKSLFSSFFIYTLGLFTTLFGVFQMKTSATSQIKTWAVIVGLVSFTSSVAAVAVYFVHTTLADALMNLGALLLFWIWMMIAFELRSTAGSMVLSRA